MRAMKILISLRECAGWSESSLGAYFWKVRFRTLRLKWMHIRLWFPQDAYMCMPRVIPKTLKMVLATLSLGAQHWESSARNRNWSAQCKYNVTGWNIMSKCLGHDIPVRQHSKSEHWAPCYIQTPSRYDSKTVESDVKPKSNKQNKTTTDAHIIICILSLTRAYAVRLNIVLQPFAVRR